MAAAIPGRKILNSDVRLLLVKAWVLSLSAKREEAARVIAAIDRLGEVDGVLAGRLQLGGGEPDDAARRLPMG